MNWIRDILFVAGLATMGTGLWFYDWRMALVVVGATLTAASLISVAAAARGQS